MKGTSLIIFFLVLSCSLKPKKKSIDDVIGSRQRQFQQCHRESDSFKQEGKIRMKLFLDTKGAVKDSKVIESTYKDPNLHACIQGVLNPLTFSPGTANEIVIPFNFQSGKI